MPWNSAQLEGGADFGWSLLLNLILWGARFTLGTGRSYSFLQSWLAHSYLYKSYYKNVHKLTGVVN